MSSYDTHGKYSAMLKNIDLCRNLLKSRQFSHDKTQYLYESGIINSIWQSWTLFWRTYWLCQVKGGIDINRARISGYMSGIHEEEAVYLLVNGRIGSRIPPYKEKTWGDLNIISLISRNLIALDASPTPTLPISINANKVSASASTFGSAIADLQITRNSSIHLDAHTMRKAHSILGRYSISRLKYPTDIIHSRFIANSRPALENWLDEMKAIIYFIR